MIDRINLNGMTVLTEAGTGPFLYSGLISAIAGAEKVYIISKDSFYGKFQEIKNEFDRRTLSWGIKSENIKFFKEKSRLPYDIDLILNLGFVRPINSNLLLHCSKNLIISYMCEKWEYRQEDLDLEMCNRFGIPVAGLNESFGNFNIFRACGQLAMKILFEAGCEVTGCKIGILSSDAFGKVIHKTLIRNNSSSHLFLNLDELLNFDISNMDVLLIAEYSNSQNVLEGFSADYIKSKNPQLKIISFDINFDMFSKKFRIEVKKFLNSNNISLSDANVFHSISYVADKIYWDEVSLNQNITVVITDKKIEPLVSPQKITIAIKDPVYVFWNLFNYLAKSNYQSWPSIINESVKIYKSAYISKFNVIIKENTVIEPNVTIIRKISKIMALVHIDHCSKIYKECLIASSAEISVTFKIGNSCWIGTNSSIIKNINHGK
ncbi:MAG: hypothetical protein CSA18_03860 [Deltaproteobacteria bacterium]|nr:MAG: hypothetical protein CSB21_00510 [Deltaproteobacteria bacterium]PIE74694.1 MAG: hypothetical protein CSA18_03860 [Deltaproteobacteria bacterium]